MFKDIEVSLPNDKNITGDKMVVHVIDSEEQKAEGTLVGEWTLRELVDTKNQIEDILEERIFEKLNEEDSFIAKNLKHKLAEKEEEVVDDLSEKEKEVYGKVFSPFKAILEGELPEGIQGEELKSILGEVFDEVEEIENEEKDKRDNIIEFPKNKE